jgi:hypothetical protein
MSMFELLAAAVHILLRLAGLGFFVAAARDDLRIPRTRIDVPLPANMRAIFTLMGLIMVNAARRHFFCMDGGG